MRVDERHLLIRNRTSGVDPLVDKILSAPEDSPDRDMYVRCMEIKVSDLKRSYLEACLIASSDFARIAGILELPVELISFYSQVFYNVQGLDKLSKLELLDVTNRDERTMKVWALSQGLDFIEWRLGNSVNINPVDGLQDLFTMAVFKAKEALFSGNSTESSKEGVKWSKLSMDMARLLKVYVMDSDAAKKDIEMALKEIIPEFQGFSGLNREEELLGSEAVDTEPVDGIEPLPGSDVNSDGSFTFNL